MLRFAVSLVQRTGETSSGYQVLEYANDRLRVKRVRFEGNAGGSIKLA